MTIENDSQEKFLNSVKDSLDQSCESLDGYTRSRLTTMRYEALASQGKPRHWLRWVPAGGIATACSVLVAFVLLSNPVADIEIQPVNNDALEDLDLLTAEEGLEFYEDYEFYQWLADNTSQI